MLAYAKSEIGLVRKTNEDSYIFDPPQLFVVADGMGGHEAGEIASNLAAETVKQYVQTNITVLPTERLLTAAIAEANHKVFQMSLERPECTGMGTTMTALLLQEGRLYWGHVGDSRLYLLRSQELIQVTKDHSLVNELVDSGSITTEEAKVHPHRNILTRAVGTAEAIQIDHGCFDVAPDDQLLLCTDGLTGLVPDRDIEAVLNAPHSVETKVNQLITQALAAGGFDNVTAILIQYEG